MVQINEGEDIKEVAGRVEKKLRNDNKIIELKSEIVQLTQFIKIQEKIL